MRAALSHPGSLAGPFHLIAVFHIADLVGLVRLLRLVILLSRLARITTLLGQPGASLARLAAPPNQRPSYSCATDAPGVTSCACSMTGACA